MENYSYSSYPDSGDSSPRSREIEVENAASWEEGLPPSTNAAAAARVKMMCSYGGRIQPRPHDNQLSYVGGDTKILSVERSVRYPAVLAKLGSLSGSVPDEICFKYQLPGEDLDALISVTNDEDLEHMMLEYDRLLRSAVKSVPRLRLFLFPLTPAPPPNAPTEPKSDRQWFVDALNSIPALNSVAVHQDAIDAVTPPPPVTVAAASPDYLFGLDKGFVPPPAVNIKDPVAPEQFPIEAPPRSDPFKEEKPIGGDPSEIQRHIQELQRLQIAEGQERTAAAAVGAGFQRTGSEETLARVYSPEYYAPPRVPEKAPPAPNPAAAQIPATAAYWPESRSVAGTRFASVVGGDQPVYLIPAAQAVYSGVPGQGYYTAVPRMVAPEGLYRDAAVYAVAPSPPQTQPQPAAVPTAAKVVGAYPAPDGGAVRTQAGVEAAGFAGPQVAYDSAGRAVYYAGAVPSYQTVTSVGLSSDASKVVKPPQVS